MRVVSFRDAIIYPAFQRMGYDPTLDLLKDYADSGSKSVNAWTRRAWDFADWPELSKLEPRNPTKHLIPYDVGVQPPPQWTNSQTFLIDQIALDPANPSNVYISLQNANLNNALTNVLFWTPVPAWDKTKTYVAGSNITPSSTPASLVSDPLSGIVYVAQTVIQPGSVLADSLRNTQAWLPVYTQQQAPGTLTNIGKILKVYIVDPTQRDGPFDIPFREYDTAFHVGFRHGQTVWVKFMTRPSQYTLVTWSSTATYAKYATSGSLTDLIYDNTTGEVFASAADNNLNHPPPAGRLSTAFWNWVPFPFVIAEAVSRGLYANLLKEEGQTGKAQAEEQAVFQELQLAIERNTMDRYDRITDQQTGVPRYPAMVSTGAS